MNIVDILREANETVVDQRREIESMRIAVERAEVALEVVDVECARLRVCGTCSHWDSEALCLVEDDPF